MFTMDTSNISPLNETNSKNSSEFGRGESGSTALSKIFFTVLVCCCCIATYHLLYLSPYLREETLRYYTLDFDTLMKAKIASITKTMDTQVNAEDFDKTNQSVLQKDAQDFGNSVSNDLKEMAKGKPIFIKGTIAQDGDGVVDLTPILMKKYNL